MNCNICSLLAVEGVSLANGKIIHRSCFEGVSSDFANSERQLLFARSEIEAVRSEIQAQDGLLRRVASFFGGGPTAEQLKVRLLASEEKLNDAEKYFATARGTVLPIFDILLEYPPDWATRRTQVHARDGSCVDCGSGRKLQAHHVVPLARGGTNRIENLKLLCEKCHRAAHGGKAFFSARSTSTLPFAVRVQVIERAISDGRDVEFLYRKPSDAGKKKRRVTPSELVEMNHEHGGGMTLCLQGHCHSRKEMRVFALKRMTGVKCV
jgi:hypothetical protein